MNEEFIEELRLEYERREKASESLTKKTKDMMMVSGIIATVMIGFYGSLAAPEGFQLDSSLNLLAIGSLLMFLTIIICIYSNGAESQQTVLLGTHMMKGSKTDFGVIKSWTESAKEDYHEAIIDEYVKCLKSAEDEIKSKARLLNMINFIFFIGLVLFVAFFITLGFRGA